MDEGGIDYSLQQKDRHANEYNKDDFLKVHFWYKHLYVFNPSGGMFDADVLYLTRWELSYSPRDVGMAAETKSCYHPVLHSYKKKTTKNG